jgi:hypothetical protein
MSLTFFSKPSDDDVLQNIIEKDIIINFIDNGSIIQNVEETLYIRKVKIKINKEEVVKKVIYSKKGISWIFKSIETITTVKKLAIEKEAQYVA